MLARLFAYVMALALLAIRGIALWDASARWHGDGARRHKATWSLADRSARAFAVSQFDLHDKTEAYEIFRHPEGGRKDVLRWSGADGKPVAELEIYRPAANSTRQARQSRELAARMDPGGCASSKPRAHRQQVRHRDAAPA